MPGGDGVDGTVAVPLNTPACPAGTWFLRNAPTGSATPHLSFTYGPKPAP